MAGPMLNTVRLELRRPTPDDFDVFATFCASDRSRWIGGPADRADAWDRFSQDLGHWENQGFGYLFVYLDSVAIGRVGLRGAEGRPETELAFSLFRDTDEGKGFAYEAALAVRDYGWAAQGVPSLVSYIDPSNTRSIALARRLDARMDPEAPKWALYDHLDVYRHPKPEGLA